MAGLCWQGTAPEAFAQLNPAQWREQGPANTGGRTRALYVDAEGTVWAGSIGGGLFRSTNNGNSWSPVDAFNIPPNDTANRNLVVSAIDAEGSTIVVGTGEVVFNYNRLGSQIVPTDYTSINSDVRGYRGFVGFPGQGVFISTDGGATFSNNNATWGTEFPNTNFSLSNPWVSVQDVKIQNGRIFAATLNGLFYSDDNLQNVTKASFTGNRTPSETDVEFENTPIMDIELGENGRVYAATEEALFISDDNGETFTELLYRTDFPRDTTDANTDPPFRSRTEVAISPSDPNVVYYAESSIGGKLLGVWRSNDGGNNWEQVGPRSSALGGGTSFAFAPLTTPANEGRGLYSFMLAVDPENPDRIFLGGFYWFEYTPDNGWSRRAVRTNALYPADPKYVPAFKHAFAYDPNNTSRYYIGTDAEIVRTDDGGNFFQVAVSGYNATDAWGVGVTSRDELFVTTAGKGLLYRGSASATNFTTKPALSAVGNVEGSVVDPDQVITGEEGGVVRRSFDDAGALEIFYGFPDTGWAACTGFDLEIGGDEVSFPNDQGPDLTPVVLDEVITTEDGMVVDTNGNELNPRYLFTANTEGVFISANPYYTIADGDSTNDWNKISPAFNSTETGIPTALALSGDTSHTLYVGTSLGRVYRIIHAHDPCSPHHRFEEITPSQVFYTEEADDYHFITDIAVDPYNPNTVVITQGGYDPAGLASFPPDFAYRTKITATFQAMDTTVAPDELQWYNQFENGALPYCPVYAAIFNPDTNRTAGDWLLMVGTEYGVYATPQLVAEESGDVEIGWEEFNGGEMKRVPVFDFAVKQYSYQTISYEDSPKQAFRVTPDGSAKIYAATHGRGIMLLDVLVSREEEQESPFATLQDSKSLKLYPNPANQTAKVDIQLSHAAETTIRVMNINGQEVLAPVVENLQAGEHTLQIDVASLPAGVYLFRAEVSSTRGDYIRTGKLVVQH